MPVVYQIGVELANIKETCSRRATDAGTKMWQIHVMLYLGADKLVYTVLCNAIQNSFGTCRFATTEPCCDKELKIKTSRVGKRYGGMIRSIRV